MFVHHSVPYISKSLWEEQFIPILQLRKHRKKGAINLPNISYNWWTRIVELVSLTLNNYFLHHYTLSSLKGD